MYRMNMWNRFSKKNKLYPGETAQMRWGFIRKLYAIVFAQMFVCTAVSVAMFFTPTVKTFMATATYGPVVIGVLVVLTVILCVATASYNDKSPWNYALLGMFTAALAFTIGLVCTYKKGMPIMIAAGVTAIVFLALTLYTFWAAKSDHRLFFPVPFLVCALIVLIMALIIKIFLHVGSIVPLIWGVVGVLIFSGLIIYYTNELAVVSIANDNYVPAACMLFFYLITFAPFWPLDGSR